MVARLRVTLVKSPIGHTRQTRATMRALGLHRIGETVEKADTPELRGMARAIRFLVRTEQVVEPVAASADAAAEPAQAAARPARSRQKKEESES